MRKISLPTQRFFGRLQKISTHPNVGNAGREISWLNPMPGEPLAKSKVPLPALGNLPEKNKGALTRLRAPVEKGKVPFPKPGFQAAKVQA